MIQLTPQERDILIQLIRNCRFTPDEWEQTFKPIVLKLGTAENMNESNEK
jgi:hypothetical protein